VNLHAAATLLIGVALGSSPAVLAQVAELDRLVGRDLRSVQPAERQRLMEMFGDVPTGFMIKPVPYHVWKTDHGGQTRYVALLGEPALMFPGGSSARAEIFDGEGRVIGAWSFQAGWCLFLSDASFEYSKALESDLVVLHVGPVFFGPGIAKEYFAIGKDRLRLVRMESDAGEAVQNEYVASPAEIGIVPDATTVDQFTRLLESSDKADVLSALVFLGGRHLDEPQRMSLPEPHESKYASLFQGLMDSPRIHALIDRLTASDNDWIAQAAKLAVRPPRERMLQ
jgi:hypothetical protein